MCSVQCVVSWNTVLFPKENKSFSCGTGGNSGVFQPVVSRIAVNSSASSCSEKRKPILYQFSFSENKFLQSFPSELMERQSISEPSITKHPSNPVSEAT